MFTAEEILEEALRDFREDQPSGRFAKFQTTRLDDVKRQILRTQASQERLKTMVGWSRMESFIVTFHGFQMAAQLTSDQAACIWGPVKYALQVRTRHDNNTMKEIDNC